MNRNIAWMVVLIVAYAGGLAHAAEKASEQPAYKQTVDVVFGEAGGTALVMDVFTPTGKKNGLGIVDVASGAWFSDRGKIRDHKKAGFYDVFCGRGYVVFAVRPGSVSKYTGLEMLAAVKRAIRVIKKDAATYGIDPDRLGITGASAGGHLACLAAVTGKDAKSGDKSTLDGYDTRVVAAGVFFPPTQFLDWGGKSANLNRIGHLLFEGGLDDQSSERVRERAEKISPALRVTAEAPPFLFIHGDADPLVPLQQSKVMIAALKKAGVSAELIVKPGGKHPWPTIREEVVKMADWFDRHMGTR